MNISFPFRWLVAGLCIVFCCPGLKSWGQASITSGTAVIDSLNSYTGTSTFPANWTLQGSGSSYNYRGTNQVGGSSGGWYGNGNMSFLGSANASNANGTWLLRNNTGVAITGFTLAFVARQWKVGSGQPTVTVSYAFSSSSSNPSQGALGNALSSLSFNDATSNINTGAIMSQAVSGINIPNGQYIFIRFIHPGGANSDNLGWDEVSFTPVLATPATAPAVLTTRASAIAVNGITAGGNVTADGGATLTAKGVAWGATINPTSGTATSGTTTGIYTTAISGLSPNTNYYYRAYATNSAGTGYGINYDTVTRAAVPGILADNSSADPQANIDFVIDENGNPDGTPGNATQYAIKETSTNTWVQANGTLGAGELWQAYAAWGPTVSGLNANTQYCFQVKARNNNNVETALSPTACVTTAAATGAITGVAGTADVCNGAASSFNLTYTSTVGSGTYTAQLSDASGSFATPTTIGSGTSATAIAATLPAGTASGNGYRVRIVNSNIVSDTTPVFTIKASPSGLLVAAPATICPGLEATAQLTFNATAGPGPFALSVKNVQANNTVNYTGIASGTAFTVDASQVPAAGNTEYQLLQITANNGCTNP